jgi:hypothetical protein
MWLQDAAVFWWAVFGAGMCVGETAVGMFLGLWVLGLSLGLWIDSALVSASNCTWFNGNVGANEAQDIT